MISLYLSALDTYEDKSRFEKFYIEFRQDMYAVAYSILNNKEDAEDAVHHAFITIADNFDKIKEIPCQEVKAYIVIIIRNTSINLYNKNKRRFYLRAEFDDNEASVNLNLLEKYEYEQLVKAISKLPQIYKDVVFLHYLQEFTTKEISKMLNISIDNVWKRIERSKKLLKKILERGIEYAK